MELDARTVLQSARFDFQGDPCLTNGFGKMMQEEKERGLKGINGMYGIAQTKLRQRGKKDRGLGDKSVLYTNM